MIAAMLLRAAVYGALYFTLPRDRRRLTENRAPEKPADSESDLTGLTGCLASTLCMSLEHSIDWSCGFLSHHAVIVHLRVYGSFAVERRTSRRVRQSLQASLCKLK